MFLKQLDIIGFKSFPDRVRLAFLPGLTAVVGPNGSGKSNIADAVRWVMGEQSVKSLRGAKMEDIIFSGTEHRRPLGYAEVVMTIDNTDRRLSVAFNEVTVTRRLYRSGESEFMLNGVSCRLKDIQMIFMDTGVGREGYSIIGQGRIDEILSARSEDRRMLFEEAAGIVKFKTRRNEALQKLERERQNLTRVNDLIDELEQQMPPLSQQAEQAKLYLSLREQYKSIQINIFLDDTQRLQQDIEKIETMLADIKAQSENGRILLLETRAAVESLKQSASAADTRYKAASDRLIGLITEMEKQESAVKLLETELEHNRSGINRLDHEIKKRDEAITRDNVEMAITTDEKIHTETALVLLESQLTARQSEYQSLDEAMRAREQALDEYNRGVMEQINLTAESKSKLRETENAYARLEADKERINNEILHNDTLLLAEADRHEKAVRAFTQNEREIERQRSVITAYEEARVQLAAEKDVLAEESRTAQATLQEALIKHKSLSDLERHHEGYYRSVKAVLRMKAEDRRYAGICGAVGELIGVPREYETAIEIALGGAAQHIITRTEEDAKRAIDMLKNAREGRATFLPLTTVSGRLMDAARLGLESERGFVGVAALLTRYDSVYSPVMAYLLGQVVVMEQVDNALLTHKKYNHKLKIVTLSGELLSPGGAITGGSAAKSGIVGRNRQLVELTEKLSGLKTTEQLVSGRLREQEDKLQSTDDALGRARDQINVLLLTQNDLRNRLAQSDERLQALRDNAEALNLENERLMAKLVETNVAVRAARKELARQEELLQKSRVRMTEYQHQITGERDSKDEQIKALTDLRVEISRKREGLNKAIADITRLTRERDTLNAEKGALLREQMMTEASALTKEKSILAGKESLDQLKIRMQEQKEELTVIEHEKTALAEAIGRADSDERSQADDAARVDQEITRQEMRREQLEADNRRLYDEIWDEYGLTYQQALAHKRTDISGSFMRREERRLRAELAPLTDVNIGAIEAYKQLKTRYDFITAQRDDIRRAEDDLRSVVESLTRQMEERFADQLTQISKHFNDVFREMFGGGKAGLRLLDENNMLESGIEIIAQPPGKSLQTLLLLSGGERALTAIALLFGILRMKPSPFCVLDEIEAALDDANVTRFAGFLKQYAGGTQFIIITHRKGTMEAADTLYGVTMQEKGISKLVSVRFIAEDEDAHAE